MRLTWQEAASATYALILIIDKFLRHYTAYYFLLQFEFYRYIHGYKKICIDAACIKIDVRVHIICVYFYRPVIKGCNK